VIQPLVPFVLFLLGVLGFLELEEVWRQDVAPEVEQSVSEAAFKLIDDTVTNVLGEKQLWWATVGFALALWELSGATRVTMITLDRVYGERSRRGFFELLPGSLALGVATGASVVAAIAIVRFGPLLTGEVDGVLAVISFIVRWLLAATVLAVAIGLNVRFGTATRQEIPWVTLGTGLVLVCWVTLSIVFGFYVTYVASYASVFGHLATFFLLLVYVHASALAFLVGIQVDACVRKEAARVA
jgi:membrane protein